MPVIAGCRVPYSCRVDMNSSAPYAALALCPQTGELLPELKKRLADSNKNLTTQALTVLGRIAKAMGRAIDRNAKPLLAPAVKNITDQKQTVRPLHSGRLKGYFQLVPNLIPAGTHNLTVIPAAAVASRAPSRCAPR